MATWELIFVVVVFFACLANIGLLYISEREHRKVSGAVDRLIRYFEEELERRGEEE